MTASFSFKGGREIEAALEGLGTPRDLRRLGLAALKKGADPIVEEQKMLAPKDQLDLEHSIKVGNPVKAARNLKSGDAAVTTFIGIDESLDRRLHIYAAAQEFGNEHNKPHPFFRLGFDSRVEQALEKTANDLWKGIEKRARRLARRAS